MTHTQAHAETQDAADPLAPLRHQFHIPKNEQGDEIVYLVGHSLGLQPKAVQDYVVQELDDWKTLGVEGHFKGHHPWMVYHELLTDSLARVVGAKPVEVVAMNTLTVNLHLMMVSFYQPDATRYKIVIEDTAFPSDRYAVASQIAYHGYDHDDGVIALRPRAGEEAIRTEDIEALLDQEGASIALVLLGGVNYLTGQAFEMDRITRAGHRKGCTVGFDLAHAAGNLALQLHDWDVDFGVWCSYKYLNGGPGCVGGAFVHERHAHRTDLPRFAGWWGHDKDTRFKMPPGFLPTPGVEGWQLSNPPILPLAALRASMELFDEAGIASLRAKSERLTGYLATLLEQHPSDNMSIITPDDPQQRGCQLSLRIKQNGKPIYDRLVQAGILCDWREPDIIRVAPVPLYNTFTDIYRFAKIFTEANKST
jgi:kynureninase